MELTFRSRRVSFALVVGGEAEESTFVVVSNTDGDFEPAPADETYYEEDDQFGFRGKRG